MNILSFNTANFVAREIGYSMTEGWMQGDAATQAWYRPIDTFAGRFGAMLDEIVTLGFSAIDLWLAQLNPAWASDQHVALARQALDARSLNVATLAGFGDNREHVLRACQVALGVGATTFRHPAPIVDRDRAFVIEALGSRGLRLGIENHPEKTPAALRDRVGDGQGVIGAMIDTGWFGSQGYNAARAIVELKDVLFGIHLKDVLGSGAHHTCRFGQGVVPVRDCAQALRRIGYIGPISVEHEPERADPREDIRASAVLLRGWMEEPFN